MAKLTHDQIAKEVEDKGYTLIDDSKYTNLNSLITVKCKCGHLTEVSLNNFRHISFTCPSCDDNQNFINPKDIPAKPANSFRIIAFDQATEKFGLSIYDDGKLVYYSLYTFSGKALTRLTKIRKFLVDFVFNWKPDLIIMEDIQYQNNHEGGLTTYKILAMLLGIIQEACEEYKIEYMTVMPNIWRKYAGTCGKNRREEKILSVAKVKEKYNINVTDDVAESILIGNYAVRMYKENQKLF